MSFSLRGHRMLVACVALIGLPSFRGLSQTVDLWNGVSLPAPHASDNIAASQSCCVESSLSSDKQFHASAYTLVTIAPEQPTTLLQSLTVQPKALLQNRHFELQRWVFSDCWDWEPSDSRQNVAPLGSVPTDAEIDAFLESKQETISRAKFEQLLRSHYAPDGGWQPYISITKDKALIIIDSRRGGKVRELRFCCALDKRTDIGDPTQNSLDAPDLSAEVGRPELDGIRIVIDPGHIGGALWSRIEERFFRPKESSFPICEGDLTLIVARLLAERLRACGAEVVSVRRSAEPVTDLLPCNFRDYAIGRLREEGLHVPRQGYNGPTDPNKTKTIAWQSELAVYRYAEIRARAKLINEVLRPDMVICLHFNAEDWGNPEHGIFSERNHIHVLVNGAYSASELKCDDVRFELLYRLLSGFQEVEVPAAQSVAKRLKVATRLPPFMYPSPSNQISGSPYVFRRDLLANRIYRCPVIYCEPYVMNNRHVYERLCAGDYEGTKLINGTASISIFREYANAVADGLLDYYSNRRKLSLTSQP